MGDHSSCSVLLSDGRTSAKSGVLTRVLHKRDAPDNGVGAIILSAAHI
jgi:hypothetical protein